MQLDSDRVRLFNDGKPIASQPIQAVHTDVLPGPPAFDRVVEGTIAWADS